MSDNDRNEPMQWHPKLLDDKGINFETVRLADVGVDHSYQRPLREGKIAEMWTGFDPAELTAVVVSRRADGSLWAVDGQHRCEILRRLGKSVFLADVREGLTVEEEAKLFYRLNEGQTLVGSWDRFHARMRAREPNALRISAIMEAHGYHVGRRSEERGISAVGAVESVYNMGRLDKSLAIVSTVWPNDRAAVDASVLLGMGTFLLTFDGDEHYDDGRTLEALDRVSPSAILRHAKELEIETGRAGAKGQMVAIAIRDAYNGLMSRGGKPKHQLYGHPIVRWSQKSRSHQRG